MAQFCYVTSVKNIVNGISEIKSQDCVKKYIVCSEIILILKLISSRLLKSHNVKITKSDIKCLNIHIIQPIIS